MSDGFVSRLRRAFFGEPAPESRVEAPQGEAAPGEPAAPAPKSSGPPPGPHPVEKSVVGTPTYELSKRLLLGRTIFLGGPIDDEVSNLVCAQLLGLHVEDPTADIQLYVGSAGGSVTASLAVHDMIQFVKCDVATHALGEVAGTALLLVAAGTRGKRTSMPHARFKFVRLTGATQGTAADIEIQEGEISRLTNAIYSGLSKHTGQSLEGVAKACTEERAFGAEEAVELGVVDRIAARKPRKG